MEQAVATTEKPRTRGKAAAVGAPLDRDRVARELARLHDETRGAEAFRKAAVDLFLEALTDGHARAKILLESSGRGLACARFLSELEDELIRAIYDCVTRYIYPAQNPSSAERMAVCAVGGYGRGTLAPGSDIDLLFLFPYKQTAWGEASSRRCSTSCGT